MLLHKFGDKTWALHSSARLHKTFKYSAGIVAVRVFAFVQEACALTGGSVAATVLTRAALRGLMEAGASLPAGSPRPVPARLLVMSPSAFLRVGPAPPLPAASRPNKTIGI